MLQTDIITFDISIIRNIDSDPVKRALASSLVQFARATNAIASAGSKPRMSRWSCIRMLSGELVGARLFSRAHDAPGRRCPTRRYSALR